MFILSICVFLNLVGTVALIFMLSDETARRREAEEKLDRILEIVSYNSMDYASDDWYSRFKPDFSDSDFPNR